MPSIAGSFSPLLGPVLPVGILPPKLPGVASPPAQIFSALLDTGAQRTCISPFVAEQVGLRPLGKCRMFSASDVRLANIYHVDIILMFGTQGKTWHSHRVMEFRQPAEGPFQILLGRDILSEGNLAMSFDGHFVFSM